MSEADDQPRGPLPANEASFEELKARGAPGGEVFHSMVRAFYDTAHAFMTVYRPYELDTEVRWNAIHIAQTAENILDHLVLENGGEVKSGVDEVRVVRMTPEEFRDLFKGEAKDDDVSPGSGSLRFKPPAE